MSRKPGKQLQRAAKHRVTKSVFLNVHYDARFENLPLAYSVGISAFGFTPRATLEIPLIDLRGSDPSGIPVEICPASRNFRQSRQVCRCMIIFQQASRLFEGVPELISVASHFIHAL
jgi:hypothetical protein